MCIGTDMDRSFMILVASVFAILIFSLNVDRATGTEVVVDKKEGLYSRLKDDVIILNNGNMKERVYGKNMVWIIEFYNSWCGHCINFAPTWRQFASDLKGWRRVVSVGALDCANESNIPICREFDIHAYPSIKIVPPHFNGSMSGVMIVDKQEKTELKQAVLDFITDPNLPVPKTWPTLAPLKSLGDIWHEAKEDQHRFVVVVFEERNSIVGKQVILDLVDYATIHVRTMLKENVEKFGILKYPSLYIINKDSSFQHLASGTGLVDSDRHRFVDKLLSMLGLFDSEGRRIKISHNHDGGGGEEGGKVVNFQQPGEGEKEAKKESVGEKAFELTSSTGVHMVDLESALHYGLRQEIAICKTIDGAKLDALRNFVSALAKYFPGRPAVSRFLWKLVEFMSNLDTTLTGDSWLAAVDSLQSKEAFIPYKVQWVACKGSHPGYRGYPCSMWTLFHTLTVAAHLKSTESSSSSTSVNALQVPLAIRGYMEHFFGCHECSVNFLKMAARLESDVARTEDGVTWLWAAHNKANKRLHGDPSEDPQHPKIQFPSEEACPRCREKGPAGFHPRPLAAGSERWNETAVLAFLLKTYGPGGIIPDADWIPGAGGGLEGEGEERVGAGLSSSSKSKDEMDWWERKQREDDLKKIRDLRQQKKKKRLEQQAQTLDRLQSWGAGSRKMVDLQLDERVINSWGFSDLDIGVCMVFYVLCALLILYLYYHFIVHKKFRLPFSQYLPL